MPAVLVFNYSVWNMPGVELGFQARRLTGAPGFPAGSTAPVRFPRPPGRTPQCIPGRGRQPGHLGSRSHRLRHPRQRAGEPLPSQGGALITGRAAQQSWSLGL